MNRDSFTVRRSEAPKWPADPYGAGSSTTSQ